MNDVSSDQSVPSERPTVALFITCLVDLFRPSVGFASLSLLQRAGCEVVIPGQQTCCGQPAYNSGDYRGARALARQTLKQLEAADYVVVPSGSCAGMISEHYPRLLEGPWRERALAVAAKTYELNAFLHSVAPARLPVVKVKTDSVAYHDGCAGLRELHVRKQPRELLHSVCGITVKELQQPEVCCGFGGTFCAKMPQISARMADNKLKDVQASQAQLLCGGDMGCLLSLAGRASRNGQPIEVRHVAELLSGDLSAPAIGKDT
ncbi:MAG: (Fe-S)-binding protein [Gammaproteobacteria bacterium]|jgi:L-lactate dehydrogenase complex protein LldE|nr:(Fe-S)-binding protein [Gammaproteobacteria bacterium]